jgi:hypothetical protein
VIASLTDLAILGAATFCGVLIVIAALGWILGGDR